MRWAMVSFVIPVGPTLVNIVDKLCLCQDSFADYFP